MKKKCPKCGNMSASIIDNVSRYSVGEKALMVAGALGITVVGATVGGPIGAVAGGYIGKTMANALSYRASSNETTHGWKCDKCGYEWHE